MGTVSTRSRGKLAFQPAAFLAQKGLGRTIVDLKKHQTVFSQGDAADPVFYVQKGRVKLTVISKRGKEATIALLGAGKFLGEECNRGNSAATHGYRHRHHARHHTQD
jgi:CRP/FNR family cyclic AMP-dependent transcriptional regulator